MREAVSTGSLNTNIASNPGRLRRHSSTPAAVCNYKTESARARYLSVVVREEVPFRKLQEERRDQQGKPRDACAYTGANHVSRQAKHSRPADANLQPLSGTIELSNIDGEAVRHSSAPMSSM